MPAVKVQIGSAALWVSLCIQTNLRLLRKRVDGCSILRLWCEYVRRQQRINSTVKMQYIGAIQRHLKLKMLWKWRAHVREKAWLTENAAATEAANHERAEVARLRETVYLIQEDLTSIETTRFAPITTLPQSSVTYAPSHTHPHGPPTLRFSPLQQEHSLPE
eukprot:1195453-Prorocentrum_minimum.AAC.3